MKNLTIRNKLLAGLAPILLVLLAFAAFSISRLGDLYATTDEIAHRRLPIMMAVGAIDTATSDYLVAQRDEVLAEEADKIGAAERAREDRNSFVNKTADDLRHTLRLPQSRELLEQYMALWGDYASATAITSNLARENKNAEATAILRAAQPKYDKAQDKLVEFKSFQQKVADEASAKSLVVYQQATWLSGLAVAIAVALMVGILVILVRSVASPVAAMTRAMGQLAKGDLGVAIPDDGRKDEVGQLATAMAGFKDQLGAAERAKEEQTKLIIGSIGTGLEALAAGDLTARVTAELSGPFAKLKADFNEAMQAVETALRSVSEATNAINSGSADIRQASDDLSRRTEQQAASLEETAAAMHEITTTVNQSAEGATRADAVVTEARNDAQQSGDIVRRAVEAMSGIERASAEISEIISVIDGIAFQTNLLALNAGVEAARAGDAGKGFAVVASEVRALAQRSADAAKDVKTKIMASSEQVEIGVSLVSETGKALERIIARISEISGLVSTIATSAEQQATGLQQVNTAVAEMDGVTQQNAAMVEQATAAARSLAEEASGLAREVARFRTTAGAHVQHPATASPVHEMQARVGRQFARPKRKASGGAAAAVAEDDWSEF